MNKSQKVVDKSLFSIEKHQKRIVDECMKKLIERKYDRNNRLRFNDITNKINRFDSSYSPESLDIRLNRIPTVRNENLMSKMNSFIHDKLNNPNWMENMISDVSFLSKSKESIQGIDQSCYEKDTSMNDSQEDNENNQSEEIQRTRPLIDENDEEYQFTMSKNHDILIHRILDAMEEEMKQNLEWESNNIYEEEDDSIEEFAHAFDSNVDDCLICPFCRVKSMTMNESKQICFCDCDENHVIDIRKYGDIQSLRSALALTFDSHFFQCSQVDVTDDGYSHRCGSTNARNLNDYLKISMTDDILTAECRRCKYSDIII